MLWNPSLEKHNSRNGASTTALYIPEAARGAEDNRQILTPSFEWSIVQNGKPVFPYTSLERIVNPWSYNCLPIAVRLDENARVEFILTNRSIRDDDLNAYPIKAFAGRIMARYWYNEIFGGSSVTLI